MFPPLAANKLPESLYIRKARVFWCVLSAAILQSGLVCYLPTQQSTVYWTMLAVVLSLLTSGWAVFGPATRLRGNPRLLLSALFMVGLTSLPSRSNLLVSFLGGNPPTWLTQALFGLVIVGISFVAWRGGPRTKTILLLLLGLVFVYRAQYAIRNVSEKQFDVVSFHHEGYRHFLNGVDPYAPPSPLYIDLETARKIYPPERLTANSILTGYPYPPLTFLLGLPFFTLLGDFRYAGVFALLLIAFLLHRVSPDSDGWLTAAITLTNPFGIQVVSFGWIETTLVMLLFLFLLCWRRWPAQSAWLFGLLISSKQTMVFWIPLGLVLLSTLPVPALEKSFRLAGQERTRRAPADPGIFSALDSTDDFRQHRDLYRTHSAPQRFPFHRYSIAVFLSRSPLDRSSLRCRCPLSDSVLGHSQGVAPVFRDVDNNLRYRLDSVPDPKSPGIPELLLSGNPAVARRLSPVGRP